MNPGDSGNMKRVDTMGTIARNLYSGETLDPMIMKQKKTFTHWCNSKLRKAGKEASFLITDVFVDLEDGQVLYALLEAISGEDLRILGRINKKCKMDIQKVANLNICFKYLRDTVKIRNIGETDVLGGNKKLILGLIWSIIVWFMLKELGGAGGSKMKGMARVKEVSMQFTKSLITPENYPGLKIENFTTSFQDGRAFLAILNAHDSSLPYDPTDNPLENLENAFSRAENMGVPRLLEPADVVETPDEKAVLCYVNALQESIPVKLLPVKEDLNVSVHNHVLVPTIYFLCWCSY